MIGNIYCSCSLSKLRNTINMIRKNLGRKNTTTVISKTERYENTDSAVIISSVNIKQGSTKLDIQSAICSACAILNRCKEKKN